ncbi:hypothetical protein RSK20926_11379 [Roseobacter sp. SK209-2-6]|nr:hypothetical protein RSK20926_11379 [Roseobacter sp. SK209-2-6]
MLIEVIGALHFPIDPAGIEAEGEGKCSPLSHIQYMYCRLEGENQRYLWRKLDLDIDKEPLEALQLPPN